MHPALTVPLFFTPAVILLGLAAYGFMRRKTVSSLAFNVTMLVSGAWTLMYALEMEIPDLAAKILLEKLRVIFAAMLPVLWLILSFSYTGRASWLTAPRIAIFLAEPAIITVLVLLNMPAFRSMYRLDPADPMILLFSHGPVYPLHLFYQYALYGAASLIIVLSSRGLQPIFKIQAWMCFTAVTFPGISSVLFQLGLLSWDHLSLTPLALCITGLVSAIGLFRFRFLDLQPIAGNLLESLFNRGVESQLVRKDGAQRFFQQYMFPIRSAKGWRIGSIVRDITEEKLAAETLAKSREQLLQSQKMEAVGQLAGGIAHDFNNLLTVIGGYCDVVWNKLPPDDPIRADVKEIMSGAERAATLTSQLLAFSRRQVLQPRTISVADLLRAMGKMLRRVIGEDIELEMSLNPDTGNISADPSQIELVIMNLVVNARDAMPGGGRLVIESSNTSIGQDSILHHSEVKPGLYVKIEVKDSGCGMDEKTLSRIYEPFFTTKEKGKGTGLGLPTAYGIISQSGGHIFCDSRPGAGTAFTIILPRTFAGVSARPPEPQPPIAKGVETVLLVEDEEAVRRFTASILRKSGYTVIEASRGDEAIRRMEEDARGVRLLITDVVMPGMNGKELAQKVAALASCVRVLYISGYTEDAILSHGVLKEGIDFIQKPFDSRKLITKVREILDRP